MRAYKFTIPANAYRALPDAPDVCFSGCVAVAIASTPAAALSAIAAHLATIGEDARWLEVATITDFSLTDPVVLAVAML